MDGSPCAVAQTGRNPGLRRAIEALTSASTDKGEISYSLPNVAGVQPNDEHTLPTDGLVNAASTLALFWGYL